VHFCDEKSLQFSQLFSFPVAVATPAGFVCAENTSTAAPEGACSDQECIILCLFDL
jgi:hypothetical protein